MGSKSGSGGGQSNFNFQNTSSTYTPNPEAMAAYRQVLAGAENVASIPFQPYSGQMVAGFSPDQQMAFEATRQVAREMGLLVGISGGAVLHSAKKYAQSLSEHDVLVIILADSGRAYLSKVFMNHETNVAAPIRRTQQPETTI